MNDKINSELLEIEYEKFAPVLDFLGMKIKGEIADIIEKSKIKLSFPIQKRIKSLPSIINKNAAGIVNVKSLFDYEDLIGLRIVVLYSRDVQIIRNLIRTSLDIKREKKIQDFLQNDQFGYLSHHIIVKLPRDWYEDKINKKVKYLATEIQLRTMSQHIWAEASHELQYKQKYDVPRELLRSISRVSALLETVDIEFERILKDRERYRRLNIKENPDVVLNSDNLESTLDSFFPLINKTDHESYSDLLIELWELGITRKSELIEIIEVNLKEVLELESEKVIGLRGAIDEGQRIGGSNPLRVRQGIFYAHTGLLRRILMNQYDEKYSQVIRKIMDKQRK